MIYLLILSFIPFAAKRAIRYLHIFQQEEYDIKRFNTWLFTSHAYDKKASIAIIIALLCGLFIPLIEIVLMPFLMAVFLYLAWVEPNPLKVAKKPLKLTPRAKCILGVATPLMVLSLLYLPLLITVQLVPFSLMLACFFLTPYERYVQNKYRTEAVQKLNQINPYVIGITGSFGKTSVKHILGHILSFHAPALFTAGSINSEMGITRVIREKLTPKHKYFIVEMGAYGVGSIARLCRLTPPKMSAITAIGAAHYERFKTLNDTAIAKLEIAHAAIQQNGKVILNKSVLSQPAVQKFYDEHKSSVIMAVPIVSSAQTADGLEMVIYIDGNNHTVNVPLYGMHHAENVAIAITIALNLGMNIDGIIMALKTTPQIEHRLEVKKFSDHILIDDAYNSNPNGFSSALDLLNMLGSGAGARRILVTPGMVELGDEHNHAHQIIGEKAVNTCDIVIAVCPERIDTLVDAFMLNKNQNQELIKVTSFKDAQNWLIANKKHGDVILLENDLPDLYENRFVS